MNEQDLLATRFEEHRPHLRAVAYRLLGSSGEAEDAVQEAWLRLSRSDADAVGNLGGWLTTVVARVALSMLRSRSTRRETSLEELSAVPAGGPTEGGDPEHETVLADAIGQALLVVLDTLAPAERLVFVLHDMFAVPFDDIAPIVDRSPAAARQLASRARRRVHGASPGSDQDQDLTRKRRIVEAFLAASRRGDFETLLSLLDPEVVARADQGAIAFGAVAVKRGAPSVVEGFKRGARGARLALVDGTPGAVWAPDGSPKVVFAFTIIDDRIVEIEILADPEVLSGSAITLL